MGLKECVITLDNNWNTYYPGQTVNGKADFTFDKPKKVRGISVKFKGVAEVKWTTTESIRGTDGKSKNMSIDNTGSEEYFSISYYLLGNKSGNDIEIPEGTHSYPFTCVLPPTLPSSFEGEFGFVRYTVKVTLDRPWKFDQETKMAFTVTSHLDLNSLPEYRNPIHMQMEKSFCCCWCKTGPLSVDVRLPVTGYCSGQTIPLDVNCENNSGVGVQDIIIQLIKFVTFRCTSPISGTKRVVVVISEHKLGSIDGHEAKNIQKILEIPPLPPSNLVNCGLIDLEYKIHVDCVVSGMHMNLEDVALITLGTVPLVGFQPPPPDGQTTNSLPDVPQSQQSSESPLLSSQPYPQSNQMNVASYPVQQSPASFPVQNAPYPPQGSPVGYPPQTMPYPPQGLPYPMPAAPALYPPAAPALYPPQTGIYPANTSPSAPMPENPYTAYPGMVQPVFKESQFSTQNIHDSTDNQHTMISGNQVFSPRYPTYGFVPK
ncbi:arrestin domain-containing protein 3 [Arctopsyche grandis]|uniref:arrestin domain-containing protein 3 n=1 Tax=Arctopsyche grandis TaxID=121162 RepID=UPI00406D7807